MNYIGWTLVGLFTLPVWALDTTEAFELGFSDIEFYSGREHLGHSGLYRGETFLGMGLTSRLSVGFHQDLDSGGEQTLSGHLFYNAVARGPFQLDVMASFEPDNVWVTATELNIDFNRWGLQLTAEGDFDGSEGTTAHSLRLSPLAYLNLGTRFQLLGGLEICDDNPGPATWCSDQASLGLNIVLSDHFELITQVDRVLEHTPNNPVWNASIGVIISL